jgi:glycosyltransferase involved in cell wall biosynthesis
MPKLLFLSSQFTGYFYDCLKELVTIHGFEVQVIRWKSASNAPYLFDECDGISIHLKDDFTSEKLCEQCLQFQPNIVYFPGWMDKDYLKIVGQLRQKGSISVMGFDNQWQGTLKQRLFTLIGYRLFKKIFNADYTWVAGEQQAHYIRRIGVPNSEILFGLYSANQPIFYKKYKLLSSIKSRYYPKRFLFVGRFDTVKNVRLLYQVFKNIVDENLHKGWSLTMVGEGTKKTHLHETQNIAIRPFMQPHELTDFIPQFGCFVLPSLHEPWGVVVHEAVSAGLPLIISSVTGAKTIFLKEGENGFSFDSNQEIALKNALLKIINSTDSTLMKMSECSANLSFQITPKTWANVLNKLIN